MAGCLFILAILCFVIGFVVLLTPGPAGSSAPAFVSPVSGAGRIPMPRNRPAAQAIPASLSSSQEGGNVNVYQNTAQPQKLNWIKLGQRIYARHPVKGELMAHVLGRILYSELWQQTRGPQSPWVPTGNAFLGFWLEGGMFLLNWQNRLYLLEDAVQLSDADIQRDFAPHARKFAQSDQTADVYFAYPPAMWHIDDIGKFRVDSTEGEGLVFRPGAVGRFIHASGDSQRALVVEDYEGGGSGQDTAWTGYKIEEGEVKPA